MEEQNTIHDIGQTAQENLNLIIMFLNSLLSSLQSTTFALGFSKLKRTLKENKLSITESLTKMRVIELKKAREVYDFRNAW